MSERLDEIRARVDKATPGPWKLWAMSVMADPVGNSNFDDALLIADTHDPHRGLRTFNAQFIACARGDVPWLLARLDAVTALVDAAEAARGRDAYLRTGEVRAALDGGK